MPVDVSCRYSAATGGAQAEVGIMFDECIFVNDATAMVKLEMIRQIRRLGPTTADQLERAVFLRTTGRQREEVDWNIEDNLAGYRSWRNVFPGRSKATAT